MAWIYYTSSKQKIVEFTDAYMGQSISMSEHISLWNETVLKVRQHYFN